MQNIASNTRYADNDCYTEIIALARQSINAVALPNYTFVASHFEYYIRITFFIIMPEGNSTQATMRVNVIF